MRRCTIWKNKVILPTKKDKQKKLVLTCPRIEFPLFFEFDFKFGFINKSEEEYLDTKIRIFYFVFFGFGFVYSENWDE